MHPAILRDVRGLFEHELSTAPPQQLCRVDIREQIERPALIVGLAFACEATRSQRTVQLFFDLLRLGQETDETVREIASAHYPHDFEQEIHHLWRSMERHYRCERMVATHRLVETVDGHISLEQWEEGRALEARVHAEVTRHVMNACLYGDDGPAWIARQNTKNAEAEVKAERFLRESLSAAQLSMYEELECFEVIGSHTGLSYRINKGTSMNIEQLGSDGSVFNTLCFMPVGHLPQGDVMLTQKIALETDEPSALRVANRWPGSLLGGPDALLPWPVRAPVHDALYDAALGLHRPRRLIRDPDTGRIVAAVRPGPAPADACDSLALAHLPG